MKHIAMYLYEIGQLKRVKRSGWWMAGIAHPESVAEHTFRTAILGYILASLNGADAEKTALICLFHDTGEARINDLHRLAKRYMQETYQEEAALVDQVARLPQEMGKQVLSFFEEYEERNTPEGRLARDADLLECLIQAREYQAQGHADTQDWITNCYASLQTEVAKNIADACLQVAPKAWWQDPT